MNVNTRYRSVGCNRVSSCLDWGINGKIAYGACNAVAIYDPEAVRIDHLLQGHSDRVSCATWLYRTDIAGTQVDSGSCSALATGAADCKVNIWHLQQNGSSESWALVKELTAHDTPISGLASIWEGCNRLTLISIAGEDRVCIWTCTVESRSRIAWQNAAWDLPQVLDVGTPVQHTVALTSIANDWLLLALGGADNNIRLCTRAPDGAFQQVCKLAGHGDWVRCLAFTSAKSLTSPPHTSGAKVLLASASQDRYIRVWSISPDSNRHEQAGNDDDHSMDSLARYAPKQQIQAGGHVINVVLEALLVGHEDWVHSLAWQPTLAPDQRPCLLSAAMDRTMMLWRPESATGLWMSEESVGDAGAQNLGYYTCAWSPDAQSIVAHGYTGALHLWSRSGQGMWLPRQALGGHYGGVVDMCWGMDGACLFTASEDQTARIFAEFRDQWCEIARPQVHGHDFSCIACLPSGTQHQQGRILYASGSEEKVLRVLEAPQAFLDTMALAHGQCNASSVGSSTVNNGGTRALGAAVAALGLSNKAIYANGGDQDGAGDSDAATAMYTEGPDLAPNAAPSATAEPPLEEHLAQSTMWPEIFKLYGHGNDLYCVAADPLGHYFASACKAQSPEFASIWLWDVGNWTPAGQLQAHTLTVTQLAFSPDGSHLLSVARDRSFAVFRRQSQGVPFQLVKRVQKAHSRIIWAASWTTDGQHFATSSRDGTVKVWSLSSMDAGATPKPACELLMNGCSVTAVAFAPSQPDNSGTLSTHSSHCIAVGLENGVLELGKFNSSLLTCQSMWRAPDSLRHSAAVRRLAWRPRVNTLSSTPLMQLATCSDDHCVQILDIELDLG